tara:strand:- start:839 stop:1795 length:957 start_codon:yes stop_codon:yes gene_type:complete
MKILIFVLLFCSYAFAVPILIPPGSNAKKVADILKEKQLIKSPKMFYLYLRTNKLTTSIHTGQFDIPQQSSYQEISAILTGKKQQLVAVTIPEGFTLQEIAARLEQNNIISNAEKFLSFVKKNENLTINQFIKRDKLSSLEGLFFPDTYHFSRNSSYKMVYQTFIKRFNAVLIDEYRTVSKPRLSFYDTLILASIIEKEAGTVREMPLISGVFHNRLKKRMYLASCPTVGYAMGQPRKKSLTYKDLEYKSPFNTYKNKGLPPTPISSPGRSAFRAALYPKKTPYLYFVSKNDGSGTHVFSTNLNDHLNSQRRILSRVK